MLSEVCRLPNLLSFSTYCVDLELRPLPSISITRLHQYYGPLRHPVAPGLSLTGVRLIARTIALQGFPCCVRLPLPYMPPPIPRRNHRLLFSFALPVTAAFPVLSPGRLPYHSFRGLLSVHITLRPTCLPNPLRVLYTGGFSRFVTSTTAPVVTGWNESYRTGFAPAEKRRLGTAHDKVEISRCQKITITLSALSG